MARSGGSLGVRAIEEGAVWGCQVVRLEMIVVQLHYPLLNKRIM